MKGQTNATVLRSKLQRKLRNNSTVAEQRLWFALRSKQLGGYKFRRQHAFENYILDFVCLEKQLVIEVDGGQHSASAIDHARDTFLRRAGFRVLRFWNTDVLQNLEGVTALIAAALGVKQN